jgi:hypothetical protein
LWRFLELNPSSDLSPLRIRRIRFLCRRLPHHRGPMTIAAEPPPIYLSDVCSTTVWASARPETRCWIVSRHLAAGMPLKDCRMMLDKDSCQAIPLSSLPGLQEQGQAPSGYILDHLAALTPCILLAIASTRIPRTTSRNEIEQRSCSKIASYLQYHTSQTSIPCVM